MRSDAQADVRTVGASRTGPDFVAFYLREHEPQVRRAFLLTGNPATAHDVVADAFLAVLRRWDRLDDPGPYLSRCVLNGCRDAQRLAPREQVAEQLVLERGELDAVDEMAELLLELPFRQRAAVVLRFYGGHSEREIAAQLDCRTGTVGSLIHRALRALHTTLIEEEQS